MTDGTGWEEGPAPRRARWGAVALAAGVAVVAVVVVAVVAGPTTPAPGEDALHIQEAATPPAPVRRPLAASGRVRDLGPGDLVPGRWRTIEPGPLSGRTRASMTWTGREAVLWGGLGANQPRADGAAYAPDADRWTVLTEAPLAPRFDHAAAWTGSEVVIAGGTGTPVPGGEAVNDLLDVAAFNPRTARWRALPSLPFPTGAGHVFAAADRIFAVATDVRPRPFAVLEPGADRWTTLDVPRPGGPRPGAEGNLEAGVAHDELVAWNRYGRGSGVVIDLEDAEQWRPLNRAPRPLTDIAACCVLVASDAGAGRDGEVEVIAYHRSRDVWRSLGQGAAARLAVSTELVFIVHVHSSIAALDMRTGTPLRLPPAPLRARYGAATAWADDRLLIWGGEDYRGKQFADGAAFAMSAP